jgi:hypothetical protein
VHLLGYDFSLQASKQMSQSWLSETAKTVVGNQTNALHIFGPFDATQAPQRLRPGSQKKAAGYQTRPWLSIALTV